LDTYIELFTLLRDAKNVHTFTNIEENVFKGLQDDVNLTKLAVLALYSQAISRLYMSYLRGTAQSALELGGFHERVKEHCQAIINNTDLLISRSATAATGALAGQVWDRPDLMYRLLSMSENLPNLHAMLCAFFQGVLSTWERFTSEFAAGRAIDRATSVQRSSVWNPPTNDVRKGALGQCRHMLRRAPNMTDNQRNVRVM
jgi:hypothetical protein